MSDQPAPAFSVVVPNWNGASFLRRGLGSLYLSARALKRPFEIIVVDDCSTDESVDLIRREFPQVRLLINETNEGFGPTANRGVVEAMSDLVILCNNDLIAREEFISRLIEPMDDNSVFAVSAKTIDWEDGAANHVEMHAAWRRGLLAQDFSEPAEPVPTTYFQGGACVVRRRQFLDMGGFCTVFSPGYWEDYDIAYHARKCGLKIIYEPRAVASHLGKGSMTAKYSRDRLQIIQHRNQILFTWLNMGDMRLWIRHCLQLPGVLVHDMARVPNSPLTKGFIRALPHLPRVMTIRRHRRSTLRLTDREILQ